MKLSTIYSSGMVLQQKVENPLGGLAESEEKIEVDFCGRVFEADIDDKGFFSVMLPEMEAGGPYSILIKGSSGEEILLEDVLFGDVFLLGGQSNMELPIALTLDCYREEVENVKNDQIRMFQVPKNFDFSLEAKPLTEGCWVSVDPKSVMDFSAIGYYFSVEKYSEDKIPVGLVHTAVGGAPVEALMSKDNVLSEAKKIRAKGITCECDGNKSMGCLACYEKMYEKDSNPEFVRSTVEADTNRINAWYAEVEARDPGASEDYISKWSELIETEQYSMPSSFLGTKYENKFGTIWLQKVINLEEEVEEDALLCLGTLIDSDKTYVNGEYVGETGYRYPPRRYPVKKGLLRKGENVISVRLCIDANVGGALCDMPYEIRMKGKTIPLDGEWRLRNGCDMERLDSQTFFIWHTSALYYSMIETLKGMKFKAVLFYQGESNCGYPQYYADLFIAMVREWRGLFGAELPFVAAEVTYYLGDGPVYEADPFAEVRKEQHAAASKMDAVYMVETYDLGQYNELHPQNKKDVALRMYEVYRNNVK